MTDSEKNTKHERCRVFRWLFRTTWIVKLDLQRGRYTQNSHECQICPKHVQTKFWNTKFLVMGDYYVSCKNLIWFTCLWCSWCEIMFRSIYYKHVYDALIWFTLVYGLILMIWINKRPNFHICEFELVLDRVLLVTKLWKIYDRWVCF